MAPLKKVALKIRFQSVANYGHVIFITDIGQLLHLFPGEKLCFIYNQAIIDMSLYLFYIQLFYQLTGGFQAAAGTNGPHSVPGIRRRFEHEGILPPLLIVIAHHQRIGGLAGAHGPVAKIQLCHFREYPFSIWQQYNGVSTICQSRCKDGVYAEAKRT